MKVHLFLHAPGCTDVIEDNTETNVLHTKRGACFYFESTDPFRQIRWRNTTQEMHVNIAKRRLRNRRRGCARGSGTLVQRSCGSWDRPARSTYWLGPRPAEVVPIHLPCGDLSRVVSYALTALDDDAHEIVQGVSEAGRVVKTRNPWERFRIQADLLPFNEDYF